MPQKTVTLEDQVYWDLTQLTKGRQSAFVNEAVKNAIIRCAWQNSAMVKYAQLGEDAGIAELRRLNASLHPNQTKLGDEEE
jgi:hypothetical protein